MTGSARLSVATWPGCRSRKATAEQHVRDRGGDHPRPQHQGGPARLPPPGAGGDQDGRQQDGGQDERRGQDGRGVVAAPRQAGAEDGVHRVRRPRAEGRDDAETVRAAGCPDREQGDAGDGHDGGHRPYPPRCALPQEPAQGAGQEGGQGEAGQGPDGDAGPGRGHEEQRLVPGHRQGHRPHRRQGPQGPQPARACADARGHQDDRQQTQGAHEEPPGGHGRPRRRHLGQGLRRPRGPEQAGRRDDRDSGRPAVRRRHRRARGRGRPPRPRGPPRQAPIWSDARSDRAPTVPSAAAAPRAGTVAAAALTGVAMTDPMRLRRFRPAPPSATSPRPRRWYRGSGRAPAAWRSVPGWCRRPPPPRRRRCRRGRRSRRPACGC